MIKLITLWVAWRLLRALLPILVVATIALLVMGGASRTTGHPETVLGRLQHETRPLEQQLQHTLRKAFVP